MRDYLSRPPWDRQPRGLSRKLSIVDQKNLVGITLWEKRARALDGLHKLVPGFDKVAPGRPAQECGTDARSVLRDHLEQRQLLVAAHRLSWDDPSYGQVTLGPPGTSIETTRVGCGPDLDGDGVGEAIVWLTSRWKMQRGEQLVTEGLDFIFLASRHGGKWRALLPLGISGNEMGVERSMSTSAWLP